ncbi:transcriptional regulator [Levilactobacillus koreensis JCM 16448]|uniref:TetR-like C-terminal domain-containing protein n=1 Tax=Levilactobacillus koreensis TaxID=637971 RepID=UPI0006F04A66|nr:TetR-like C-terminal domain-containing protein [Levilactobacillus koreensis]KRK90315.1 transcriptional regulator [Levilactobacillus koreensis JCM 16448]
MGRKERGIISQLDPRVVRTNEQLRQALSELLQQQSLQQISVQKLTSTAQLTRGTFYLHYKDKTDFYEQTEQQVIDEWFATARTVIAPEGKSMSGFSLGPALRYVDRHHQILTVLLHPQFTQFRPRLQQRFERELLAFSQQLPATASEGSPIDIQITFLTSAFLGLVEHWLNDNRRYRSEFLAQSFRQLATPDVTPLAAWFALSGTDIALHSEKSLT